MNAVPATLQQQADQLSESVTRPIPGSRKVFVEGSRDDLRVPMREIALTPTPPPSPSAPWGWMRWWPGRGPE